MRYLDKSDYMSGQDDIAICNQPAKRAGVRLGTISLRMGSKLVGRLRRSGDRVMNVEIEFSVLFRNTCLGWRYEAMIAH
ncbi:MAG: hypothetical protein CMJ78_18145 [Planctomycetaceae bacterium]|nr:hypothetical protein [Planctomycetaceae bacterium]